MEDDPDRWYKMVLEDEEAMSSREQIVERFKWMTYEVVMPVDPGLGDADPAPGFGPLKVSPLSYALSQQNLYYDCSGEARGKGHCQHRQLPGRANLESFRLRTGSNRTAASLQREYS